MKLPNFPQVVAKGNARVTIYRHTNSKAGQDYEEFKLGFYVAGKRRFKTYASYEAARAAAEQVTGSVNNGDVDTLVLDASQKATYLRAVEAVRPTGVPLDVAAIQFADAIGQLEGRPLSEAVAFFRKRLLTVKRKRVGEVVDELLEAKGKTSSALYVADLRKRLKMFSDAFQCDIADITPQQILIWADGHQWGERTRFNRLTQLRTLFNFAKARSYYSREEDALAGIDIKWKNTGAIDVFTPGEMRRLLSVAKPEIIPFLTIGAFAGLRSAEITRLDWSEVNLAKRFIEVKAAKAKTASRRIIPVVDNLAAWLAPYAKPFGPVCELIRPEKHAYDCTARAAKLKWKRNGLRHSFVSYRLATVKDAARVALEAGNSPQMIFQHYRELVQDEQAKEWFALMPNDSCNILPSSDQFAAA